MARKVLNGLDLVNQRIQNLADPSSATDAATKQYVDGLVNGLDWKQSVRAATTAAGTLATGFANGSVIDGVTLATGNRILIKNQATASENGIYVVAASGAPTRATDADASAEVTPNMTVYVEEGTTNADTAWTLTTNAPITLGTTGLTFAQVGGGSTLTAGNGITISSGTISVNPAASGGISVAAGGVSVDTAIVVRKFAASIGNGSSTSIAVTHNLGTRDVTVAVYDNTTFEEVLPDVVHTDANNVTLTFATAPATNAYRVVVHG